MSTVLGWLAQNTIAVAVIIPLVLVACRLCRNRPAVQHALWLVVLLKFLTPPLVSWPWTIEEVRDSIWPAAAASSMETDRTHTTYETQSVEEYTDVEALRLALSSQGGTHAQKMAESDDADEVADEGPDHLRIALLSATATWLGGAAMCLVWQIRRIARHATFLRRSTIASGPLTSEVQAVAEHLGLRPPQTMIACGILSPFVWCLGRLRLIWPESLSSRTEVVRLRGVIAHELAHVRRGDHWVAWLELVAGVVWWWNPLYWAVRRRLRESAEMACDALAIGTNPECRREYAEMLLELSAGFQSGTPAPVLAVSAGAPSSFERRLTMILSDNVSGKASSWGILAAILLALIALPGWSLAQPKEPPKAWSPADDAILRDLIEKGKFAEAKARLEALRAKQTADKNVGEGVFPEKWRDILTKELPAECLKGVPKNAALSWKTCMSCHGSVKESEKSDDKLKGVPGPEEKRVQYLNQLNEFQVQKASIDRYGQLLPMSEKLEAERAWLEKQIAGLSKEVQAIRARQQAGQPAKPAATDVDVAFTGGTDWRNDSERANADLAAAKARVARLEAMKSAPQDELAAARADVAKAAKQQEAAVDRLRSVYKSTQARLAAAWANVRGLAAHRKAGAEAGEDEEIARLELERLDTVLRYLKDELEAASIAQGKPAVAEAEAQTARANADLRRLTRLYQDQMIGRSELEAANAQSKYAEARLKLLQANPDPKPAPSQANEYKRVASEHFDAASRSPLDLGERYLKSVADLKKARAKTDRLKKSGNSVSQSELGEAQIDLERMEHHAKLLAAFIQDAVKTAQARRALAEAEFKHAETLVKKGYASRAQFDAAKSKLDESEAAVKQLQTILDVTGSKPADPAAGARSEIQSLEQQLLTAEQKVSRIYDLSDVVLPVVEQKLKQPAPLPAAGAAREIDELERDLQAMEKNLKKAEDLNAQPEMLRKYRDPIVSLRAELNRKRAALKSVEEQTSKELPLLPEIGKAAPSSPTEAQLSIVSFHLREIDADSASKKLKVLTTKAHDRQTLAIAVDSATNSLIVRGRAPDLDLVKATIAQLEDEAAKLKKTPKEAPKSPPGATSPSGKGQSKGAESPEGSVSAQFWGALTAQIDNGTSKLSSPSRGVSDAKKDPELVRSRLIQQATDLYSAGKSNEEVVALLYQAVLERAPTKAESDFCVKYLASMTKDRKTAIDNIVFQLSFAKAVRQ